MPADYSSAAAALSVSPSPLPSPSPTGRDTPPAPWARPSTRTSASRRISRPYNLHRTASQPFTTRLLRTAHTLSDQTWAYFQRLPLLHRIAVASVFVLLTALSILFLIYSHKIFAWLGPVAKGWRALPLGWVPLWLLVFVTAFPPMMGYGTVTTLGGFVFGFPLGWPIVATASVAGSTVAFFTSRGIFSGYVHSLVGTDKRFVALGQVLRHDGLLVLTGVRFCPLPYSMSNGFLATIPSITPWAFAVSTALASPKLLVHVFIGSRLAKLAEEGDEMSAGGKAVNYISIIVGGFIGLGVGLYVYKRTMARAAELGREEAEEIAADAEGVYADNENARLMDPNDAGAALMDDDDISLWDANGFEDEGAYRDNEDASPAMNGRNNKKPLDEEATVGFANGTRR